MTYTGIDTDVSVISIAGAIKRAGYSFVGRYFNPAKTAPLSKGEAEHLHACGLGVLPIWEEGSPTSVKFFNATKGIAHGRTAWTLAQHIGIPTTKPLAVTVDYDPEPGDLGVIKAYLMGFRQGQAQVANGADTYHITLYGSGLAIKKLVGPVASHGWLAESGGWTDSRGMTNEDIHQTRTATITFDGIDIDCDLNTCEDMEAAGIWTP